MTPDTDPVQGFSPAGQLLHLLTGHWIIQAVRAACELGVPDQIGRNGLPVEALARQLDLNPPSLLRLLRALASVGIFTESSPSLFKHTPMSALLRHDMPGNLGAFARFQGQAWHWNAWSALDHSVRTGRNAMDLQYDAAHCFDYFTRDQTTRTHFDAAMAGYAAQAHAAVIEAWDFSGARTIVDVGGGQGTLIATILDSVPQARGVLFDRPEVIAVAASMLDAQVVSQRCELRSGDFFDAVPAGGDLYLMSSILHDWQDAEALAILRQVRAVLPTHARLLVIEHVVPEDGTPHPAWFVDLEMMLITGGRERTVGEYAALFNQAGLTLTQVLPTATAVSILEARIAGEADAP